MTRVMGVLTMIAMINSVSAVPAANAQEWSSAASKQARLRYSATYDSQDRMVLRFRTTAGKIRVIYVRRGMTVRRPRIVRQGKVRIVLPRDARRVRVAVRGRVIRIPTRGSIGSGSSPTVPVGVTLSPVPQYPAGSVWGSSDRFALTVWFESINSAADLAMDQAAGLNGYVALVNNSQARKDLMASSGMGFLLQTGDWLAERPEFSNGWLLSDEIDMQQANAAGAAAAREQIAQSLAALPADGKTRYINYGKGVAFWNSESDAAAYVNFPGIGIVSDDVYWFTDPDTCSQWQGGALLLGGARALTAAECHRAANYGAVMQRVRYLDGLDGVSRPIWGVVEVGHPFTNPDWPTIQPAQIKAAVWHSIIGGANGIIYFNHSFSGPCPTQHALRDPCYAEARAAVTEVNTQITALAPVLNSPTATGYATSSGGGLKMLTKYYNNDWYLFTGSDGSTGTRTITLPASSTATTVTVLNENRTLPVSNHQFTDTYATPNTTHHYKITG